MSEEGVVDEYELGVGELRAIVVVLPFLRRIARMVGFIIDLVLSGGAIDVECVK